MKKILALILALCMVLVLGACGSKSEAPAAEAAPAEAPAEAPAAPAEAPAAGGSHTATFSTGESFAFEGDTFTFYIQCDAPADMGEPAPGEEGTGFTASEGTVSYSDVSLGGPFSYPTSELVTISGVTGDIDITVTDALTSMGEGLYHIYTTDEEIADAIAYAEEMAAQMAANPMGGSDEASGEASDEAGEASGEASGGMGDTEQDYEIELDGQTVIAHYADVDNGDQMTKSFEITVDDMVVAGSIDKGEWVADSGDEAAQAIVDAVHAAFDPSWSK